MRELVVISGKGGTGKTSVVASFAALAEAPVLADCDVDAADLHLVMAPEIRRREVFRSGREAVLRLADCIRCGACLAHCRFDAVRSDGRPGGEATLSIDPIACEGCGVCVRFCPAGAIDFPERACGEWYVSDTRFGPMVHARLAAAAENSGKLVTAVRTEARRIAEERGLDLILVDGPPGIGCPVIASITGAAGVLAVTEPTPAGEHDLDRVLALAAHFDIPAAVCVNKWDLNPAMAERIEGSAGSRGAAVAGRIRYDAAVTSAQVMGKPVVEFDGDGAARDIRWVWEGVRRWIRA
ncbi:MAG: ATP-binding protein [Planctomycetes bacterium]|nr:ATP-binding protein [Planctomycetota bacterium]